MAKKAKVYTGAEWVDLANATTDLSQYANLTTYQPTFRNILINGDFSIWQRGTTFNTNNSYSADRWYIALKSLTTGTRETSDLPPGFRYGFKFFNTNSTSGPAISQFIETDSVIPIRNKVVTFSAWVKVTDFSGDLTPVVQYSTAGDTISSYGLSGVEITNLSTNSFGAPSTWTRVSTSFTVPENALGLGVKIIANSTQGTSSIIRITGAQLELGSVATPFEQRPIGTEIFLCQRYFEKSYNIDVAPGTITDRGAIYMGTVSDLYSNATFPLKYCVEKRALPTVSFYSKGSGSINTWQYERSGVGVTNTTPTWNTGWLGTTGGLAYMGVGAAYTGCIIYGHWTSSAEL
jgi:hypothetical protein